MLLGKLILYCINKFFNYEEMHQQLTQLIVVALQHAAYAEMCRSLQGTENVPILLRTLYDDPNADVYIDGNSFGQAICMSHYAIEGLQCSPLFTKLLCAKNIPFH